jgi:PIN domain nuclease of toxin-antitoxin system
MNLLLDTHSLIWFLNGDEKLSAKAKSMIFYIETHLTDF